MADTRRERVRRFLECARVLTDSAHPLRKEALRTIPRVTGLSLQNVVWALDNALEVNASDAELTQLVERTPVAARAHVLLSANVFVAALRAIAIALACAPKVCVRPSRREPEMVRLLAQAAPGHFEVVAALEPAPVDHVWAYGSDSTMAELRRTWPKDVTVHAHGSGFGVVVFDASELENSGDLDDLAARLAIDVAAFDQRGCLSPRLALVQGDPSSAERLCQALARAMAIREVQIPLGDLTPAERAEIRRFRDTMCMAGAAVPAGTGWVTREIQPSQPGWLLPPIGRVLHVRTVADALTEIREHAHAITTIGVSASNLRLAAQLRQHFPNARVASIGRLQCPALDGPVDLRNVTLEAPVTR